MSWKGVHRGATAAFPGEEDEDDQDETLNVLQQEEEKAEAEEKVDPSLLTDDHLKAALLAHGVKIGPIVDTTRWFYERTLRRLQADDGQKTSTIETIVLSSDSEDNQADCDGQEEEDECSKQEEEEKAETEDKVDPSTLTDDHLKAALLAHGVKIGPNVDTTRWFYERTLRRLQADYGQKTSTIETIVLSSDSEDNQADCDGQEEEEERSKHAVIRSSQLKVSKPVSTFETKVLAGSIQSCTSPTENFSITQMVQEMEGRRSKVNDCEIRRRWSSSDSVDMTAGVDERRQSQHFTPMVSLSERQEKELLPDIATTPTAISVACRRPIKGAAGRPVRYQRRPISPRTEDRKEVECGLVPVQVQFVVFVFLAVLLFVVEDQSLSPLLVLVYNLVTSLCNTESNLQETVALLGQD
ncbi:lamina-associated polypeptide 2, isoforms beta/gamma-like isoform X2 [Entelurus aequoreus]|uniref:lamina-associated polypeptide 2, isoforms beta/gamma-like isoform X2 n=1 Tax=Entelurus aequoreus TaxID=161455 RepID=UPI002B1DA3C8|nr:lamina-associated polypeptide 2, isoforms beta/gamma-like isoform X2 [Entelurus aequoreus]